MSSSNYIILTGYTATSAKVYQGDTLKATVRIGETFSLPDNVPYQADIYNATTIQERIELQAGPNYAGPKDFTLVAGATLLDSSPMQVVLGTAADQTADVLPGVNNYVSGNIGTIYGSALCTINTATVGTVGAGYRPAAPITDLQMIRLEILTNSYTGFTTASYQTFDATLATNGVITVDNAIAGLEANRINTISGSWPIA